MRELGGVLPGSCARPSRRDFLRVGALGTLGAALAVLTGETFEIALGGFAAEFVGQRGHVFFGQQRWLLRVGRSSCEKSYERCSKPLAHAGPPRLVLPGAF